MLSFSLSLSTFHRLTPMHLLFPGSHMTKLVNHWPGHTVLVALVPGPSCQPLAFLILVLPFFLRTAPSLLFLWLCPSDSLILLQASERPLGCTIPFCFSQPLPVHKGPSKSPFLFESLVSLSHVNCPAGQGVWFVECLRMCCPSNSAKHVSFLQTGSRHSLL